MQNTAISVTEAVREFSELVNRVYYTGIFYTLTRGGKAVACLAPSQNSPYHFTFKDFKNLVPKLSLLNRKESASFAKDVKSGRKWLKTNYKDWDI